MGISVFQLKRLTSSLVWLVFSVSAFAQVPFSSLEERMTFQEFRNSGLEKLSQQELEQLNQWVRSHSLGGEEAVFIAGQQQQQPFDTVNAGRIGFQDYQGTAVPLVLRIKGTFDGWRGKTKFEFENGMVWRQIQEDQLGIRPIENAEVTLEPGLFGSWYLGIEGVNKRIQVKRVE